MPLGNHEFDKGASHAAGLGVLAEFPVMIYPNDPTLLENGGNLIIETSGPYSKFICTWDVCRQTSERGG